MNLTSRWQRILKESWLVRLAAVVAVLNTAQQFIGAVSAFLPPTTFAVINAVLGLAIMVASIIQQDVLHGTDTTSA